MEGKYPEHDKLKNISKISQELGSILDYLNSKGYTLRKWYEDENYGGYVAIDQSITQILAEYYKIDLNMIDVEKMQMINEIRNNQ